MNPTQTSKSFSGLPIGPQFQTQYEIQQTVPVDGSKADLRAYSPFVIRVLPPTILGDTNNNVISAGPSSSPGSNNQNPSSGTVRTDNRDAPDFSTTINTIAGIPPSQTSYAALAKAGGTIPGLSAASTSAIQLIYNQAQFGQVFSPTVQQNANGQGNSHVSVITPMHANDIAALSILLQVKKLMDVPPLILLINPQSMSIQYTKIAQFQERSRKGYIYQAWGEELPKITFSFKIGAYTTGLQTTSSQTTSGVQRASRRDSASFQQLMALLTIFQSGGYIQDTIGNSMAYLMIGNIAIEYDQVVYVGHFDTFSFGEDETQQNGGIQFDMEFTAVRVFDTAEVVQSVTPMNSPSNPFAATGVNGRGTVQFNGSGTPGTQLFTAPTVGGTNIPVQPWSGGSVGVSNSGAVQILTSRRGV